MAAARAGAVGLIDLTFSTDSTRGVSAVDRLKKLARGRFGLIVDGRNQEVERTALRAVEHCHLVVLDGYRASELPQAAARWRGACERLALLVRSEPEADAAQRLGFDLLLVKGHEAGGLIREETTFVLLQRILRATDLPVYAWGGIGLHTAAACRVAGAAGVVLDWQLALTRESSLPAAIKKGLAAMDGSETATVSGPNGEIMRLYARPGMTAREQLQSAADTIRDAGKVHTGEWNKAIATLLAATGADRLWPIGQDGAFAKEFAASPDTTVARAIGRLREHVERQVRGCATARALQSNGPLAQSHGTTFPVVQGPMTRVSDVPEFAAAVAEGGGLPFLALALMRGKQVGPLLARTKELLGQRPWGVGILGFVEHEIRAEQLAAVEAVVPPFAIIAGGRPDQAASMEAKGIKAYLHVPSPGMLETFVREGARRFVFEGRECGGHVGPRTSFVLWNTMVRVLLEADLTPEQAGDVHVLFAGGIHDAASGAMVSAIAQPLVERGMKIGVLLGTAYLFTQEIVSTGSLTQGFQSVAVECQDTVLLETGPGHAIRCADTNYVHSFEAEKQRLKSDGRPPEVIRDELENANLGRLRIASKGLTRRTSGNGNGADPYVHLNDSEQRREGIYMIGQLAALRDGVVSIRELHETVCDGAVRLLQPLQNEPVTTRVHTGPKPQQLDIAIVGVSCLLPGANDIRRFWHNVLTKRDCLGEVPADRFDFTSWFDTNRAARDKIYGKWGGFLEDVAFDPLKYGIPPTVIKSIEPLQLLTLELVDMLLRDAGYRENNPHRERTGVVFGVGGGVAELSACYAFRAMLPNFIENPDESIWGQLPEWTEDSFAGILPNVVSGRVANRFDLGGPNYTVDAACGSSLAAMYLACRELINGSADMVITGGADTMQNPLAYLCFAKTGALSPTGKPRVFDATADGIVISEGLGAVALKRREDAERDGDRIYAIIRAVAGGSDGRTKAIAAPCSIGQLRTLQRAYGQAGFSPTTIGLFEAHGTGTAAGDQAECQGLSSLLKSHGAPPHSAPIGSVKSMVGHTKCGAGVTGLIKMALSLHHRVLPPTINVSTPNPKAGFGVDGPLYINSELRPWIRGEHPRRAAISSFGFGGSNYHAVLEEYTDSARSERRVPDLYRASELFVFSGRSRSELWKKIQSAGAEIAQVAQSGAPVSLADVAYTFHVRAGEHTAEHRLAVVACSMAELSDQLATLAAFPDSVDIAAIKLPAGVYYTDQPLAPGTPLAYLFPGQGSQFPDMLRELAVEFTEVADCFEVADRQLQGCFDKPLSHFVFPPPSFTNEEREVALNALKATNVAQPALGVCGVATMRLLESFGVRPDLTAGHSYGELVALHAAGSLEETSLYRLSWLRGEAIVGITRSGASKDLGQMLAVRASESAVRAHVDACKDVWVSNCNSPEQTVVSGTNNGLATLARRLNAAGIDTTPIPVACAFHSPIMAPAGDRFRKRLDETEFHPPKLGVYSNTKAAAYPQAPDQIRGILAEQLVSKVRFADEIEAMYAAGSRVFIEVGPNGVLTRLVREILKQRPHAAIATQAKGLDGVTAWQHALAALVAQGIKVNLERAYEGRAVKVVDLRKLVEQHRAGLPAHIWLVNGGYVRPANAPRRDPKPKARLALTTAIDASASMTAQATQSAAPSASTTVPQAAAASQAPVPMVQAAAPNTGHLDKSTFAQIQQTMRQFLDVQQAAISAYFGSAPAAAQAAVPETIRVTSTSESLLPAAVPPLTPDRPILADPPVARTSTTVPTPASPAAQPAQSAAPVIEDLEGRLIGIVSDRTGYPSDMLNLDANLEADLGIDSIKRVEIIAAFRRVVLPAMQEPPSWFMERMTAAKSLRAILTGVNELVHQHAPATPVLAPTAGPASAPAPAQAPVVPSIRETPLPRELEPVLVGIVAERTGYPTDMLNLDANLEADLGIDSIKRVEIIAAFRRTVLPAMQEPPSWFMERMTAAKSLRAILTGVDELVGGHAAPAVAAPATPAPSMPAPDEAQFSPELEPTLVGIVAERTGYPSEMLELDANLEADLGIDSIKRVEIIAAFRRVVLPSMQEPPSWFMERMTAAKSLRAILSGVRELVEGAGLTPAPVPAKPALIASEALLEAVLQAPPPAPTKVERSPRCTVVAVETPLDEAAEARLPEGVFLLTDDGQGIAKSVEAKLRTKGGKVVVLSDDALSSAEAARAAIEQVRREHGAIGAMAHLVPLRRAASFPEVDAADWWMQVDLEIKGTLFLLQALAPELQSTEGEPMFFAALSIGGGDFDEVGGRESLHPWRGGLAGLLKCAAKEWERAVFRAIDLDELPNGATTDMLLRERAGDGPVEVGYRNGRRLTVQASRADWVDSTHEVPAVALNAESVVVITGGARGITAEVARELAERCRSTMILLGRTPLPPAEEDPAFAGITDEIKLRAAVLTHARRTQPNVSPRQIEEQLRGLRHAREIRSTLADITSAGARVEYIPCDVADSDGLEQVLRGVLARHGRIDAVIHGAGVIEDKLIPDKTAESFDRVLHIKLDPVLTLCRVLDPLQIKVLVLFSSVAGFFGNPGQGDYAAANEILNRMARRLRQLWPGRILSMNWGPWSGSGMVAPEVARQFESRGVGMVSVAAGRRAMWQEIVHAGRDGVRVLIGGGPWTEPAEDASLINSFSLTPLLAGQVVRSLGGHVLEADVYLDGQSAYLIDHRIDEKPVLPLMAALELMAELAAAAHPHFHVCEVTNLRQYNGVVLDQPTRRVLVRCEPIELSAESGEWRVRITDPDHPLRAFYEAMVRTSAEAPSAPAAPALASLQGEFPLEPRAAYEQWLFHGPTYQVIDAVTGVGREGIDARVRPSCRWRAVGGHVQRAWLIDPIVLDSAAQLAILWSRANFNTTPLPNRVKCLHRYAPVGSSALDAFIRTTSAADGTTFQADVWFVREGRVVLWIEGLEGTGSALLNRLAQRAHG